MIVYQLTCSNTHEFEAWFKDSATYGVQASSGDVECPFCGDISISKMPMAPNIASKTRSNPDLGRQAAEVRAREVAEQILRAVGKLRDQVVAETDDVGDHFADEARRIHYGETEERNIRGVATDQEASDLDEEGVEFYRLPASPRRDG